MADSVAAPQEDAELSRAGNQLEQETTRLTPFQVFKGILVQPRATFVRLRKAERGHWWLALLFSIVAISLLAYATVHAESTTSRGFTMPAGGYGPQQRVSTPRAAVTPVAGTDYGQTTPSTTSTAQSTTLVSYVVPIVSGAGGVVLGYLLCAFVVFAMSIVFGGKSTYTQVFRTVVWAWLPLAIGNLVQAVASLVTGGTPAPGLSAILTSQEAQNMSTLQVLLGHLDVYLVWSMVLLGVGIGVTSKLSKRKSVAIVIIYLALAAGVIVGMAAASGALSELFGGQFNLNILTRGARLR